MNFVSIKSVAALALISMLFIATLDTAYAEDNTVIDGYELPPMFEEEASEELPVQHRPHEIIQKPETAKPKITKKPQKQNNAFTPIKPESVIAAPAPKIALKHSYNVIKPMKRPSYENIAAKQKVITLSTQLNQQVKNIQRPQKRPARLLSNARHNYQQTTSSERLANLNNKKQSNKKKMVPTAGGKGPSMPAVPAGSVVAAPLTAPPVSNITADEMPQTRDESHAFKNITHNNSQSLILIFNNGDTNIDDKIKSQLNAAVLNPLVLDQSKRIEIKSFAEQADSTKSSARRISLSRALAVRTHLMAGNLESHRMDIRALGDKTSALPLDRIEIRFIP